MGHIIDSEFYKNGWGTEEMRRIFDDRKRYQRWLDIEVSLAKAQGELGIIPKYAAQEISQKADIKLLNKENIKKGLKQTGHSLVPLIRELERICEGDAGEYIHYGPTTQDIEDTGMMLEIKDAYKIIFRDLCKIEKFLIELAEEYKEFPMVGRTHNQHALPITLGLKFARWAAEIRRNIERLKEMKERIFVGMLHGGTGTMAGLGEKSFELISIVMDDLGLKVPEIGWSTSRDYLAEYIFSTGLIGANLGNILNEIFQLSKTEVGELHEPMPENYVGSSTMPHKRNPETCEFGVALSKIIINNTSLGLTSMIAEHERDTRSWRLDWHTIPENSILLSKLLESCKEILSDLEVNKERIKSNLNFLDGMIFSEALMLYLGQKIGKQSAHELIRSAVIEAKNKKIPFKELLLNDKIIRKHITSEELDSVMVYKKHIGKSKDLVNNVINQYKIKKKNDKESLIF